jgi:putative serine protease PepD
METQGENGTTARPGRDWLPANTDTFQSHRDAGRPTREPVGVPAGSGGLWVSRGPEATTAPLPAARPSPPGGAVAAAPVQGTGRRTFSAILAAILVAGTAGGAAGSALTANALLRPQSTAPRAAIAAPALLGANPVVTDTGSLKALYKQAGPAVVSVQTASASVRSRTPRVPGVPPNSPGSPGDVPSGQGTGFIVDGEGHIITNYHVVEGASRVSVVLSDGTRVQAQVVGQAPDSDVALLKATLPAEKVSIATLGDSDAIEPGDLAVAIGTPFGLEQTLTAGIVSAVNRDFGQAAGRPMRGLIQTDAAINPGNSGGPLFNAAGEVIGVTTSIESPVRANVGVGFAIPSNTIKRLLPQLKAGQTVKHAWIGISGIALDADVARDAGLPADVTQGVLLATIAPDSPAARAGLRGGTAGDGSTPGAQARGGDVIVAVDGTAIRRVQDLSAFLDAKQPGDTVSLTVLRNGSRLEVRVTLAPWPADLNG